MRLSWFPAAIFAMFAFGATASCAEGVTREDVSWTSSDGVTIRGVLHLPSGGTVYPAVVFVNGSGRGPSLEVAATRAHAEKLSRRGIAVLTYDKRGTGASEGAFPADFDVMAADLQAGMAMLAHDRRIDDDRIGVIAISQGWWVSVIAADRGAQPRFMVGIGAPSVSAAVQDEHVLASSLRAEGASARDVEEALELLRRQNAALRGEISREDYAAAVETVRERPWFAPNAERFALAEEGNTFAAWYRRIMDYDPKSALSRLRIPMAVFQGEDDMLVSPERSAADYAALRAQGAPIEFFVEPGVGHDLSSRIGFLPRTWSGEYWDRLDDWIHAAWQRPRPEDVP